MSRNFTTAEIGEIRTQYRQSKSPGKQIEILADMHTCEKDDIRRVLRIGKYASFSDEPPTGETLQTQSTVEAKKKSPRHSYDQAVRNQVVKAVLLDGDTQAATAERFGVPAGNVSKWVQSAKAKQKEFMDYPGEPETSAVQQPKAAPVVKSKASEPSPAAADLQHIHAEIERGVNGLIDFLDVFDGCGLFDSVELQRMESMLDRAQGYGRGVKFAIEKAGAKK